MPIQVVACLTHMIICASFSACCVDLGRYYAIDCDLRVTSSHRTNSCWKLSFIVAICYACHQFCNENKFVQNNWKRPETKYCFEIAMQSVFIDENCCFDRIHFNLQHYDQSIYCLEKCNEIKIFCLTFERESLAFLYWKAIVLWLHSMCVCVY